MNLAKLVKEKKAIIGEREVMKEIKNGKIKKVVIAKNIKDDLRKILYHYKKIANLEIEEFDGTRKDLGIACGKPFLVSIVGIRNED